MELDKKEDCMMDFSKNDVKTREDAMNLLYNSHAPSDESRYNNCFDDYGNYSYPSEIVLDSPNTACGTAISYYSKLGKDEKILLNKGNENIDNQYPTNY